MIKLNKIYNGDCLEIMKTWPSDSIDCCVTSPPYWGLRDYGVDGQLGLEKTPEEFVAKMVAIFAEVKRVLKDDATLWLNLGDSYVSGKGRYSSVPQTVSGGKHRGEPIDGNRPDLRGHDYLKDKDLAGIPWRVAFALQQDGWYLRQDIIWAKPNPMPESVTDRCTKAHEYIFLMTKSPRYFYDADAIREDAEYGYSDTKGDMYSSVGNDTVMPRSRGGSTTVAGKGGTRNKRSVWTVTTAPFTGWTQTYHLSRVEPDGPCDGRMHIVSPSCPEHGGLFDLLETALCGEHAIDYLTDISHTNESLSQEQFGGFLRAAKPHDYYFLGDSLDCFLQQCFPTAKDRSSESHKKALSLLTNPSCTPSVERLTHIQRTLGRYGLSVINENIFENNTWPGEMDVHSLGQTICRTVNKFSFDKLLTNVNCHCGLYHIRTEKSSHFATFPPKLIEPCILAGCPEWVCKKCGKARVRVIDVSYEKIGKGTVGGRGRFKPEDESGFTGKPTMNKICKTTGWTDCGCGEGFSGGIVLDPFMGSGTTAMVAYENRRNYVGCELNSEYIKLNRADIAKRKYGLFE